MSANPRGLTRLMLAMALLLQSGGCLVGPDFSEPPAPVASKWLESNDPSVVSVPLVPTGQRADWDWWTVFHDPVLDRLIGVAYEQNLSLVSAGTRVLQARAELGVAIGEFYPQLQQGKGSMIYDRPSDADPTAAPQSLIRNFWRDALGLTVNWELDFWGKFRRGIESADAVYLASIASYDYVLATLLGDVATTYVGIRTLQTQIAIARENIIKQKKALAIAEAKFHGGTATKLDAYQAENVLAATEATIPQLTIQLKQGLNALRVLLGMAPEPLDNLLGRSTRIPVPPRDVVVGIPADLVRRRPDIRAAELAAAAQSAQVGIAEADLYPAFSLFGTFGTVASNINGNTLRQVFQGKGITFGFGPSFQWNILNYGQITNTVRVQDAKLQGLLVDYQNLVLKAQQEVEDGLASFLQGREQVEFLLMSVAAADAALGLAILQWNLGTRDFTTVLTAEQNLYTAQNNLAMAEGGVSTGLASVYRALGGGFKLNGKPAAGIAIYQTPDANSLKVASVVAAKMEELSRRFPAGLHYSIPYNTTIFIQDSINEVYKTLRQAGVLVLIVILVFLQNFRATLVPATTVPVTIIGAFAGMAALGYTVNLSTLFALILAIGVVVDDAIVIVEGVSKYIEEGMSGHDAAIKAMSELFGPIIGITLVLMAVFLPSAFVPGLSGQMFAQFALVIAVTALISAVNAATLKPMQCALWLRTPVPPAQRNFFYRGFNRVYQVAENAYTGFIGRMVRLSGPMVVIGLVLSAAGIWGIARLPTAFIPNEDPGYLMVAALLPDGAALGRTTAALDQAGKVALDTPGVDRVIAISGLSVLDNFADLSSAGVSFVVLKPWDQRSKAKGTDILSIAEHLQTALNAATDGRVFVLAPPPIQGIGNAGGVQMQLELLGGSFDYQKLNVVTQQLVKSSEADPQLQHVLTTFSPGAPHVTVTVDRDRAETLRVSVGDVFSVLSSYLGSTYVNQFNKFGQVFQVYVQGESQFRLQPDDLLNLYVRSSDNQMVPIGAVAHLGSEVGPSLVTLYNLYPSATVIGAPARGVSSGQALTTMEDIAKKTLPSDVGYQWTAMSYQEKLTGNQLYYLFGLSALLVYLCLAGQYESWILPLAVLSAVPLALLGPVIALTSLGVANNLYTQIGLILMIALSAKNGILIVEMAREGRIVHGKSIREAAVEASRLRFRPILMTSFAFGLGVVPLVLATGAGANGRISLGLSVLSGIIASTCLAVLFVPSFFALLQGFEEWRKARKKTPIPAARPAE